MTDDELGRELHAKYYADMPYSEFAGKVGLGAGEQPPSHEGPGLLSRASTFIADAVRGNAAEQAPQALASGDFLRARSATQDQRGWIEGVKQEGRELGAAVFGNDQDLAKVLAGSVDGASVVNDANGNPMIQLPAGKRVYANQPGLDPTDGLRLAGQIASYLPAARAGQLIGGASTLARAGVTGLLSGVTNFFGQQAAGRDRIDGGEVAFTAASGAAGEVLAPAVSRAIGAGRELIRTGASRERAALEFARKAGIEQPTNAQIQSLSRALGEIDAGADPAAILQGDEFGFLYTTGQRMADGDPRRLFQLQTEEYLRSPAAQQNMQAPGMISAPANIFNSMDTHN